MNETRGYKWMPDEDAVFNHKEGRIVKHIILLRERRGTTCEPIGRGGRERDTQKPNFNRHDGRRDCKNGRKVRRGQVRHRNVEIREEKLEEEEED